MVENQLANVVRLADRVGRIQPRSRYWRRLDLHVLNYRFTLQNYLWAASGLTDPQDDDALTKLWKEQEAARKKLVTFLEPTVDRQRPPRQHPLDRWPALRRLPESFTGLARWRVAP